MFSGWVGDQDPTFDGLVQALERYVRSGWDNYVGFGSDIGGYRSGDCHCPLGRSVELFIRWYQLGAFSSLMENGGNNEHRPWEFDQPNSTNITDNYRLFVETHMQLVPYLLTTGAQAYANNQSILQPLAKPAVLVSTYEYKLGPDILVVSWPCFSLVGD